MPPVAAVHSGEQVGAPHPSVARTWTSPVDSGT